MLACKCLSCSKLWTAISFELLSKVCDVLTIRENSGDPLKFAEGSGRGEADSLGNVVGKKKILAELESRESPSANAESWVHIPLAISGSKI